MNTLCRHPTHRNPALSPRERRDGFDLGRISKIWTRSNESIPHLAQPAFGISPPGVLRAAVLLCCAGFVAVPSFAQGTPVQISTSVTLQPSTADTAEPLTQNGPKAPGVVKGSVVDPNGMVVSTAIIKIAPAGKAAQQQTTADSNGYFIFNAIPAGSFQLMVTAPGFATVIQTGILHPGETLRLADIPLPLGVATTEVRVSMTQEELAEQQIHVEEKQRVLGVIPNFFVTYDPHALPLTPRQKFQLAWRTNFDPITFIATGAAAGIEQANNTYSGYGQGARGYAKRYGAAYADGFIGNMLGNALLPSLLKQDPRYFYKGTGSTQSRILYAIANSVVCKGDNGKWQVDYSGILGGLAAGGISNAYYPAANRNGAALSFENAGIGIGFSAAGNLFQEFLVRKLTPHTHDSQP